MENSIINQIKGHMEMSGMVALPSFPLTLDGQFHRFKTNKSGEDGWYIGNSIRGYTTVNYGDWSKDIKATYKSHEDKELPMDVKIDFDELLNKQKEEEERRIKELIKECQKYWRSLKSTAPLNVSPYLVGKKLNFHNSLRQIDDMLIVPLYDVNHHLMSVQYIYSNGIKRYRKGLPTKDLFYFIDGDKDIIYLTEGVADALTLYETTGNTVVSATSANQLPNIALLLKKKYGEEQRIIIVGDNDSKSKTGQKYAYDAKRVGDNIDVVIPQLLDGEKKTDVNDTWVAEGKVGVLNMLTQIQNSSEKKLKPVKKFDIQMLPEAVQDFVQDVAHRLQVPLDFVAAPLIVAFGSLIGARCGVKPMQYDDWVVHPNLWCAVVGNPGTRKTPAVEKAMAPLRELQKKSAKAFEEEIEVCANEKKIVEIEKKVIETNIEQNLKNKLKKNDPVEVAKIENDLGVLSKKLKQLNEIKTPVQKRYYSSDATTQKIGEILKNNPRGLLILVDELTFLFETFNAKGREGDRSFYLQGWSGTTGYTVDRIGRGTINIDKLFLSLCGTIQPGKLLHYVRESMTPTSNDGLAQRLQLVVYPDPITINDVDVPPNNAAKNKVRDIFQKIDSMDFTQYDAQQIEDYAFYQFSKDAQKIRSNWLNNIKNQILTINADDPKQCALAEHLSKYESLMPSLALIFHIVDIASGVPSTYRIRVENVEKAITFCEYLQSHAERIYHMNTNPDVDQNLQTAQQLRLDIINIFENENLNFCKSTDLIVALRKLRDRTWSNLFSNSIDSDTKKLASFLKLLGVNSRQKKVDKKNVRVYELKALRKSNDIDETPATGATAATSLITKEKIDLSDDALPLPAATEYDNNESSTEKVAAGSITHLI